MAPTVETRNLGYSTQTVARSYLPIGHATWIDLYVSGEHGRALGAVETTRMVMMLRLHFGKLR